MVPSGAYHKCVRAIDYEEATLLAPEIIQQAMMDVLTSDHPAASKCAVVPALGLIPDRKRSRSTAVCSRCRTAAQVELRYRIRPSRLARRV